jgi:hypothetical protein
VKRLLACTLGAAALLASASAQAEELPKRPLPRYDPRDEEPSSAGEVLVWVPRILFSPLWVVSEFVIRRPLSLAIPALEQAGLKDFLSAQSDYILFPTVVADFGFRPSIGLYGGVNNLWFEGHQVRARASFGGVGFYKVKAKSRVVFDEGRQRIGIFGQYRRREDDTYGGEGPDVRYDRSTVGRFTTQIIEGGVRYDYGLDRPTSVLVETSVRDVRFESDSCCGPSLYQQIADGDIARPDGLDGYLTVHPRVVAALDSRPSLRARQPWGRAEVQVGTDLPLTDPGGENGGGEDGGGEDGGGLGWVNYGAEVGGGIGLWRSSRRLQLSVAAMFADPLDDEPIPFNGLVRLGGDRYLRGFGGDALYGRSAAVTTLKYSWPIWVYLDGVFQAAVGNVFGPHLEDFDPEKLRMSFGLGIGTNFIDEDKLFELTFAVGTDTFEQGTGVSSVRIAFGITDGF